MPSNCFQFLHQNELSSVCAHMKRWNNSCLDLWSLSQSGFCETVKSGLPGAVMGSAGLYEIWANELTEKEVSVLRVHVPLCWTQRTKSPCRRETQRWWKQKCAVWSKQRPIGAVNSYLLHRVSDPLAAQLSQTAVDKSLLAALQHLIITRHGSPPSQNHYGCSSQHRLDHAGWFKMKTQRSP